MCSRRTTRPVDQRGKKQWIVVVVVVVPIPVAPSPSFHLLAPITYVTPIGTAARVAATLSSNFRGEFHGVSTKKNSIIAAPVGRPEVRRRDDPSLTTSEASFSPASITSLDPFKWSQCNRTISIGGARTAASAVVREEEITAVLATCWS